MKKRQPALLVPLLLCAACGSNQDKSARLSGVSSQVRAFIHDVAENVSRRGPAAWQDYFENSSSFFMAADGRVQFPDGASAQSGIPALARTIKNIELHWGDGLRIDPLTEDLAVIAAPWHENITLADGRLLDVSGYFTAVAERSHGRWQFRNAHWSSAQPDALTVK